MITTQSPSREQIARRVEPSPLDSQTWEQLLQTVRTQHPGLNRVWFDEMQPRQLTNGVIQVKVSTPAQLNFCQSQCQPAFTAAAQAVTGRLISVAFHCDNLPTHGGIFNEGDQPLPLNPDYVFENFVTGPCNRLAQAASVAVAENPGKAYNPLFIHGGVGLGKSHLLQAICQKVLEREELRIVYLSCDSFINQFMNSIESGDMNSFRYRYRHADVLVIDDIHFLAGRERTQEEFFHTFNTLYQQHKQIILSADCPPSEIPELEERLISRFNWGMVARIEKPGYETRMAILQKKARIRGMTLPEDVLCYVAQKIEANTRELEGAIIKIQAMATLQNNVIDVELVKAALGESATPEQKRITIEQITNAVIQYYNVRSGDLSSKKRHKSIAFPRQVCMFLARKHTRYSLEEIGGFFGGRDHTTVLHAVRTIEKSSQKDAQLAEQVTHIERQLGT